MLGYDDPTALKRGGSALRSAIREFLFGPTPEVGWFCRHCNASGTVPADGNVQTVVERAHKQVASAGCSSIRHVVIRKVSAGTSNSREAIIIRIDRQPKPGYRGPASLEKHWI